MASSLPSLEVLGSPEKPGSSVIHLCMSVKRTVSGSVSGYLSVSAMAMSSVLSQSKVAGMLLLRNKIEISHGGTEGTKRSKIVKGKQPSVIGFLGVILVPFRNFFRVHLDSLAAGKKGHCVFLRGRLVFDFFDIRVAAAHLISPATDKPCSTGRSLLRPYKKIRPPLTCGPATPWKRRCSSQALPDASWRY